MEEERHDPITANQISQEAPFVQFENPDIIYYNDSIVVGIEDFEYDASKRTSKGSKMRKEEAEIFEHGLTDMRNNPSQNKTEMLVPVKFSFDNYIKSWFHVFCLHLKNALIYRRRIEETYPGRDVYLALYFKDVTTTGNYVIIDDKAQILSPLHIKEIINVLKLTKHVDFVISKTKDLNGQCFFEVLSLDETTLDNRIEECYNKKARYISHKYSLMISKGK